MANPFEGIMFPVKATTIVPSGQACRVVHPQGQRWLMKGVPPGICSFAFNVMFPAYWTLRFGGSDPQSDDADQMIVTCSVPGCGAQFRIERIGDEEAEELDRQANHVTLEELAKTIPTGLSRRISD